MSIGNRVGLFTLAVVIVPLWGCGGVDEKAPPATEDSHAQVDLSRMSEAERQAYLAEHQRLHAGEVSASQLQSDVEGGGGWCYCSYCNKHHDPECL